MSLGKMLFCLFAALVLAPIVWSVALADWKELDEMEVNGG